MGPTLMEKKLLPWKQFFFLPLSVNIFGEVREGNQKMINVAHPQRVPFHLITF